MKKNIYRRLLLNIIILLLLNIVASILFFRIDLTEDKRYSTSKVSKEILTEINDVIYIKVYLEGNFPAGFTRLQNATHELLNEFRSYSSYIEYEFINPNENPNKTERDKLYQQLYQKGLNPTNLQVRKQAGKSEQIIFPGAIIYYKGQEVSLNLLKSKSGENHEVILNNSIENLEFEFSNALNKLINNHKPVIAFLDGNGELDELSTYSIINGRRTIRGSLSEHYKVERFNIKDWEAQETKQLSISNQQRRINRYDAIIIAKPTLPFNELEKLLIDQYIMQGGKVLWLLDGVSMDMDSLEVTKDFALSLPKNLGLGDMIVKYGARINHNLIMDLECDKISVMNKFEDDISTQALFPWVYNPLITSTSNHPISNNLDAIRTSFASNIDTIQSNQVKKEIILQTSNQSKVVLTPHRVSLNLIKQKQKLEQYQNDGPQTIALLLTGKFNSYFKNRLETHDDLLIESQETSMLIVSDGDLIKNHVSKQQKPYPLGYNPFSKENFEGNTQFILNSLHYLTGKKRLLALRSNNVKLRLLNKKKINLNRLKWQLINIILPMLVLLITGLIVQSNRNKKYK